MTQEKFPTPHALLLETSLYSEVEFAGNNTWDVINLLYFNGTYDSFCTKCKRDSTFQVAARERPANFVRNLSRENSVMQMGHKPPVPTIKSDIYRIQAMCTRHNTHTQDFLFFVDHQNTVDASGKPINRSTIQKVGQQPSFGDVHMAKVKKYSAVLTKDQLRELNRAIGLASHDVGIGSYVYLRRVFEALVEEAHVQSKEDADWDEDAYVRSRMAEKIKLLKNHLPTFLTEHPEMYSLLSLGVHELSEKDCLTHFDTLRIGIELILDEKLERKEKNKKIKDAKAALAKAVAATRV